MYANLRVELPDGEILAAWDIDITPDTVVLKLDANEGESSYAVEAGERTIARSEGTINVQASF